MNKKNIAILFSLVVVISFVLGSEKSALAAEDHNSSRSNLSNIYDNKASEQKDVRQKNIRGFFKGITPSKRKKERVERDNLGIDKRKRRDNEILNKRRIKRGIDRDTAPDKFHKNKAILLKEKQERLRNATNSEEIGDIRHRIDRKKRELKERRNEKRAKIRKRLDKRARGRVKAYIKRITHRLNAMLNRLERLADRIASHLDKLSENGVDTVKAQERLTFAKQKIVKSRNDVKEMEIAIENASDSENLHSAISEIRPLIKEAIASVKEAHRALVDAIRAVRNNNKKDKQENSEASVN